MEDQQTSRLADAIAQCCHETFRKLPKHGKPARKHNGQLEWTILAGVVLVTPKTPGDIIFGDTTHQDDMDDHWNLECVSLATGSKCLPRGKQSPYGDRLNDCHAEVLARRGFNLWCLRQMQASLDNPKDEAHVFRFVEMESDSGSSDAAHKIPRPFKLRNSQAQFHLYVSQAPCGDATTESLAQIQSEESKAAFFTGRSEQDATIEAVTGSTTITAAALSIESRHAGSKHELADKSETLLRTKIPRTEQEEEGATTKLIPKQQEIEDPLISKDAIQGCSLAFRRGRIDYDCITALRTKPGRVDSEPTLSMSCSDKMARWNVLGLTSALVASLLDRPLYLESVVTHELFDAVSLQRALYGRVEMQQRPQTQDEKLEQQQQHQQVGQPMHTATNQSEPYTLHRPKIWYTRHEFELSKDAVSNQTKQENLTSASTLVPPVASPNNITWVAGLPVEVIVNGCKAGASSKNYNQPLPVKSRSRLCKSNFYSQSLSLWVKIAKQTRRISEDITAQPQIAQESGKTYREWKHYIAPEYQRTKAELLNGVFKHWVQGLPELEQFDDQGNIVHLSQPMVLEK